MTRRAKPFESKIRNCPDCQAKPGEVHESGCDVEHCSVCGGQRLLCGNDQECIEHDRQFARWTGIWPGAAEAEYLQTSLNELVHPRPRKWFFIKPGQPLPKYSVLVLYPEYLSKDKGLEVYLAHVAANTVDAAHRLAQEDVAKLEKMKYEALCEARPGVYDDLLDRIDPSQFPVLLTLEGWHNMLKPWQT